MEKSPESKNPAKISPFNECDVPSWIHQSRVIVLHLLCGQAESEYYFFGSLAAIYQMFPEDLVGVSLATLYNKKISPERPYRGRCCEVFRSRLYRIANGR